MDSQEPKADLEKIRQAVTENLRGDGERLLWESIGQWQKSNGEGYVREQLDAIANSLSGECLSRVGELRARMPRKE